MRSLAIEIPGNCVREFCDERRIRKLALFGSILRDEVLAEAETLHVAA